MPAFGIKPFGFVERGRGIIVGERGQAKPSEGGERDGAFAAATASISQTVARASTTTTLSAVPLGPPNTVYGQPVTFTAVVSSTAPGFTPTGTVTFLEGGNSIGSAPLGSNGQASFTIATLAVGNHTITASYSGDFNFTPSSGSVTQVVNKNSTTTAVLSSSTVTP